MAESTDMTEFWQQKAAACQEEIKRLEEGEEEAERRGDREDLQRIEAKLSRSRSMLARYLEGAEVARRARQM